MILSLIVAMDEAGAIGFKGKLPWRLSADLQRFRQLTMGHHLIAGRKTYESIGRPLPGREMIVITRDPEFRASGCTIAYSVEEALKVAALADESEVFIIGGAELYRQTLPRADRLYLTEVQARVEADTFFPPFDRQAWQETACLFVEADDRNQYASTFRALVRQADTADRQALSEG